MVSWNLECHTYLTEVSIESGVKYFVNLGYFSTIKATKYCKVSGGAINKGPLTAKLLMSMFDFAGAPKQRKAATAWQQPRARMTTVVETR